MDLSKVRIAGNQGPPHLLRQGRSKRISIRDSKAPLDFRRLPNILHRWNLDLDRKRGGSVAPVSRQRGRVFLEQGIINLADVDGARIKTDQAFLGSGQQTIQAARSWLRRFQ